MEVNGLGNDGVQVKLNKGLKDFCLAPTSSAEKDTTYDIMPVFEVVGEDLLSISTYDTAYTAGAAYPVGSIRTQLFSLTMGDQDADRLNLWCDGDNHATRDYWKFDILVTDLASAATDRLLPIIDALKNLGN